MEDETIMELTSMRSLGIIASSLQKTKKETLAIHDNPQSSDREIGNSGEELVFIDDVLCVVRKIYERQRQGDSHFLSFDELLAD
jgi:hypothetical protein